MRRDRIVPTALVLTALLLLFATTAHAVTEGSEAVQPNEGFHELAGKAISLSRAGQADKALDLARRTELLARRVPPPANRATANGWNQVGIVYFENGYLREAKNAYELGLSIGETVLPPTDALIADFHNNLGQVAMRMGPPNEARRHLEAAIELRKARQPVQVHSLAVALDNLGVVLQSLDELDQAETMHKQALAIFEKEHKPRDAATALNNLGLTYFRRRDYSLAERYLRAAFATHQQFGLEDSETLTSAANLARVYLHWGEESRADELVNYLVTIGGAAPAPRHMHLANVCSKLASEAFNLGRLGLAERFAARAVALYESLAGPVSPETLDTKLLLAEVLARKSNFSAAAEDTYQHLLNVYGVNEKAKSAQVEIALGKMLLNRGSASHPAAKKMFEAAIADIRSLSPIDVEQLASALGNLGLLFFHDDQPTLAQEKYAEALALLEERKSSDARPWLLYIQAQLQYHIGAYDKARVGYEEAKALWASQFSPNHPFVGTTAANVALVYWIQGDVDRALRAFEEASEIEERGAQRDLVVGTEWERLAYARGMQDSLYKVFTFCFAGDQCHGRRARLAATLLLQRKSRVLDAMAHTMADIREHSGPEERKLLDDLDRVRSEVAAHTIRLQTEVAKAEDQATLQKLKEEEDRLQSAVSYQGARLRARLNPLSLEQITDVLGNDAVLVEYLKYSVFDPDRRAKNAGPWRGERYAALVLRSDREPQLFDLAPAELIDQRVEALRTKLQYPGGAPNIKWLGRPPEDFHDDARALYQLVVAPIRKVLAAAKFLFVSPDGALNLIPFGVLEDLENKRVSDVFVVNYLYSGRELLREAGTPGPPTIVVIANPDFEAELSIDPASPSTRFAGRGNFRALPGTHDEASALKALFQSATVLEGPKATVAALKGVKRPAVLHVATHGFFDPLAEAKPMVKWGIVTLGGEPNLVNRAVPSALDNPMLYSGLALAGANRAAHRGQHSIISAFEIANLDLQGTQLVVLSACQTGLGIMKHGEEFAGLRRAISIAGAASQVISLWKVDDKATQALMTEYYRLLLEGHGRAAALQLAQQHIESDRRWSHPTYWAAFVPSGDSTPIADVLAKVRR